MQFSLSGGLSEMGKSIANTAGDMMLTTQRAELEKQRLQLAETLAEGRESRGREQQAGINAAAADKEQTFRSGESLLNREHEDTMLDTRETGENTRAKLQRDQTLGLHNVSEANAESRFEQEMQLRVNQAQEATTDKKETQILNAAIAAGTKTIEQSYTTADGSIATRPMKVTDPDAIAKALRRGGLEDMANIFAPKPAKKVDVTGKPKPPLASFMKN